MIGAGVVGVQVKVGVVLGVHVGVKVSVGVNVSVGVKVSVAVGVSVGVEVADAATTTLGGLYGLGVAVIYVAGPCPPAMGSREGPLPL